MDTKNTKIQNNPTQFWFASAVTTHEVHTNEFSAAHIFELVLRNHDFNFKLLSQTPKASSNNSSEYFSYEDTITNTSTNPPQSYKINGVAYKETVCNKTIIKFNGSGFRTVTFTDSEGRKIETTYKVYSKMQGEMCKNGNIKIIIDEENGETSKAKIDGKESDFNDLCSSESNFCLKKVK